MSSETMLSIEVVYGVPEKQVLLKTLVPEGTTIEEAIVLSGIVSHFLQIVPAKAKVGIFSRIEKLSSHVKQGDRIEIYRPLIADPKEMRKLRVAKLNKKQP
ncbi:MAG: RnfH family protein [Psychromonas sp.]|nr:RnfH family protein [Psychromonas sp.]